MLGYEAGELVGESSRMIYPDQEEFERVGREKYRQMQSGGVGQIETRFQHKDGHILHVLLRSTYMDANDMTRGVVSTVLDITARKSAEQALIASERHYRLLAEHMGDIISVLDFKAHLRFITPACKALLGYETEEVIGQVMFDYVYNEDQEKLQRHFAELAEGGEPGPIEFRLLHKDGTPCWVETKASLMVGIDQPEILAVTRGITERKAAEAALAERQFRYLQLFENISDGVAVYQAVDDGRDFVIREFNRASERICGILREQVVGRLVTQVFPDVAGYGLLDTLRRVWRDGGVERLPAASCQVGRIAMWVDNQMFRLANGEVVAMYRASAKPAGPSQA
jgi:PAS domain S-box-containing protein